MPSRNLFSSSKRRAVAALLTLAAASVATGAGATEIIKSDTAAISGGLASLGFARFNPALGTLDKIIVSITGSLQFTVTIPPGGVVTPTVDIGATGLGGSGFGFAGTGAQMLFSPESNPIVDPLAPVPRVASLNDTFSIDFTVDAASDLVGFALPDALGSPAPLIPPTSVDTSRSAFEKAIGVLETLTFIPDGFTPDAGIGGTVSILATYDFTPTEQTAIPEPTGLALLAAGLALLGTRRAVLSRR
jgi:hypothetical protein